MYRNVYSVYVKEPHRQIHSACVYECIFFYIHSQCIYSIYMSHSYMHRDVYFLICKGTIQADTFCMRIRMYILLYTVVMRIF